MGTGYQRELQRLQSSALAGEIPLREKNIRQDLILNNYLRYANSGIH